ncbi:MAG: transposase [Clostridia bacterium]
MKRGVRIRNGEQLWSHTLCNEEYVSYGVHKKRGKEAIEEMELLKFFTGILMHDHFKPYYQNMSK